MLPGEPLSPEEEEARKRAGQTFASQALPNDVAQARAAGAAAADEAEANASVEPLPSAAPPEALPPAAPPPGPAMEPIPGRPAMVKTGETTVSERSSKQQVMNDDEKAARQKLRDLDPDKVKLVEADAKAEKEKRQGNVDALHQTNVDVNAAEDVARAQREKLVKTHQEADAYLKKRREDYGNFEYKDLWASKPAGAQFLANVLSGIGDFGAHMAGRAEGGASKAIESALAENDRKEKLRFEKSGRILQMAREDATAAHAAIEEHDLELKNKKIAILEKAERMRAEALAQAGVNDVDREKDKTLLGIRETRAKEEAELQKELRATIEKRSQTTTNKVTTEGGAAGGVGKPSGEDIDNLSRLDNDLANLDKTIGILRKNPKAWDEYKKNYDSWLRSEAAGKSGLGPVRGILQLAKFADVSPEQGLKSGEAKLVHAGMAGVTTSIAKGYGGVITSGDRDAAGSELSSLANSAKQQAARLTAIRNNLANKRRLYLQNKGFQGAAQVPAQAPSASPGVPVMVRNKKTGALVRALKMPDGSLVAMD